MRDIVGVIAPPGDAPVPQVPVVILLVTFEEGTGHRQVVQIGQRRQHRVNHAGDRVQTVMLLEDEEPLAPFPGLVPYGGRLLVLSFVDLGALPIIASTSLHRRDHRATHIGQFGGQSMALDEVAEALDGRRIRNSGRDGVDAGEGPVDLEVMHRVPDRLFGVPVHGGQVGTRTC